MKHKCWEVTPVLISSPSPSGTRGYLQACRISTLSTWGCPFYVQSNLGFASKLMSTQISVTYVPNLPCYIILAYVYPIVSRIAYKACSLQFELHSVAKMAMARAFPVDKGSKEATFTALAANFGFNDKVKDLFLNGHMENLEDFRYYFADEDEIDAFVAIPGWAAPELKLQTSFVKQAWSAVRQINLHKGDHNTASPATEIGSGLEVILKEAKVRFWKRYRLSYPVEVFPSDCLLSLCYTEVGTRLLTVYDVWEVNVSPHQISTMRRSKHASGDPGTSGSGSNAERSNRGVEEYLASLHTYLLALAVVGSAEVQGAPTEEAFGTDPTEFVEVPLDVLQAYHFRASRSVMLVPEASRLAWLEERDTVERTIWASRLRRGCRLLGQVIQSVMTESGNDWHAGIQCNVARAIPDLSPQPPAQPHGRYKDRKHRPYQRMVARRRGAAESDALIEEIEIAPGTTTSALQDELTRCPDLCRRWRDFINRSWLHHRQTPKLIPGLKPMSAGVRRRNIIRRQKWVSRRTAAKAHAQIKALEITPGTAAAALRDERAACPDLIKETEDILRQMSLQDISYQSIRLSRQDRWARRDALSEAQKNKKPRIEASAQACPTPPNNAAETMPDAIAATQRDEKRIRAERARRFSGMGANKKAQQPTRCNNDRTAAQVASSSRHESKGSSAGGEAIRTPLANPVTYMINRDLDTGTRAEMEFTCAASATGRDADNRHKQGAYVEQAPHQQQRGEDLGSQHAYTDMSATPQQETADELTSIHSGPAWNDQGN
jgi:hypothetical protein